MPRTVANDMKADLGATSAEACFLLELDFEAAIQYLTNAPITLTTPAGGADWNGKTWVAVGGAIACGGTSERWEPGSSMRLQLSAVDPSILALILQLQYRGRLARLWWAHWSRSLGTIVSDPLLLFAGQMNDAFDVSHQQNADGSGTMTIETRVSERVSDVGRRRGIRTNVHSHQASGIPNAETDTIFQNIAALAGARIFWNTESPYSATLLKDKLNRVHTGGGSTSAQPASPFPGLPPQYPWGSPPTSTFGHDPTGAQG